MRTHLPAAIAVLATLAAPAFAQSALPPGATAQTPRARSTVLFDQTSDGSLWAKGQSYKVHFTAGGVSYIPVLGPKAPRNRPLDLRLAEVTVDGAVLSLRAHPIVSRDGDTVTLDHGAVREVWHLGVDAAEQDFVLSAGVRGEIRVRLAIATTLEDPVRDPTGGWRFAAAGLGHLHYGDAVIVDGEGNRLAQPVVCTPRSIELTVPATFTHAARGPITIDPVIRFFTVDNSAPTQQAADAAFVASTNVWLVVYEEVVSLLDKDVISRRFDADGNFLDEVAVDITSDDAEAPAVAANLFMSQFLVVWRSPASVLGFSRILGRLRAALNTTQQPVITIHTATRGIAVGEPDVGGSSHVSTSVYFVAWASPVTSLRQKITGARVNTSGTTFPIDDVANVQGRNLSQVAVSKSTGVTGVWMAAYADLQLSFRDDILVSAVDRTGTVSPPLLLTNSNARDSEPDVAGDGSEFLVVWQSKDNGDSTVCGMRLRVANGTITPLTGARDLTASEPGTVPARNQTRPRVASHGCRFTYTYEEEVAGGGNSDIFSAVLMGDATLGWVEGHVRIVGGSPLQTGGIGSVEEGGSTTAPGRALATCYTSNIFAALLDGLQAGGGVARVRTGCGGIRFEPDITSSPDAILGANFSVTITVGANIPLILIGSPTTPLPLCAAGCALGVAPIVLTVAAATTTITAPCAPNLLGAILAFQGAEVILANTTSACGPPQYGVSFRTTDTIVATFH